jgi:hypothetical protein
MLLQVYALLLDACNYTTETHVIIQGLALMAGGSHYATR